MNPTVPSTSISASIQQNDEITAVVPDKEKILSDLKAFMSHHEIAAALERKKLKEREQKLQEAKEQIQTLHKNIFYLENKTQVLLKTHAEFKTSINDLTNNLQTTAAKNVELDTTLKEKEEKISRLEQQVEEFKQKVELAQQILEAPIININLNTDAQQGETHLASSGPSKANDEPGAAAATGTAKGNGKETDGKLASESESSNSEQKRSTRLPTAKRGRPS